MKLDRVLNMPDVRRSRVPGGPSYDIAPYLAIIHEAASGVGGVVTLEAGENRRTEKRRLSVAAKACGHTLVWGKPSDGSLRFRLKPIAALVNEQAA